MQSDATRRDTEDTAPPSLYGAWGVAAVGTAMSLFFGEVMGLMRPVQVPLNMVGVPLAAWIHDETGSFDGAFGAFLGVYVASAAIIALLRLPAGPGAAVVSDGESGLV